jgi:hypothetical protein
MLNDDRFKKPEKLIRIDFTQGKYLTFETELASKQKIFENVGLTYVKRGHWRKECKSTEVHFLLSLMKKHLGAEQCIWLPDIRVICNIKSQ